MKKAGIYCMLILMVSCSKSKLPDGVMEPSKMQEVFTDIIKADIYVTEYAKVDSTKVPVFKNIALQNKIFSIHNVTKKSFYKSFEYYSKNPDKMEIILDSIISKENRHDLKIPKKEIKGYE